VKLHSHSTRIRMHDGCLALEKPSLRANFNQDRCALWEEIWEDKVGSGHTQGRYTSLAYTNIVFDFGGSYEAIPMDATTLLIHGTCRSGREPYSSTFAV
jgi:hypothetical protein